ncbi:MAG TPA: hypothetical protein VIR27_18565 [Mycobacteriales bacterium]
MTTDVTWFVASDQIPRSGREEALEDSGDHSGGGAAAVAFQVEMSFEGVVDRLDGLWQRFEHPGGYRLGFAPAGWV